jgi:hypothetical protein
MSLVLQPGNSFTVVRQIPNHLDTDTNYVQAVIRNAYTDAIIDTIQLTDKGGQRFSKNWQVPADSSGQGFFVSIVTSVYTDSGYTTKNGNYGDDENTYLVQDRILIGRVGGSGGGIDAFAVRKIIQDELAKSVPTLDAVYGAIGALQREINRIPKEVAQERWDAILTAVNRIDTKEPPESFDAAPVLAAIEGLRTAIDKKEVTPPTDLTPILERLDGDKEEDQLEMSEMKDMIAEFIDTCQKMLPALVADAIGKTSFVTSFITHAAPGIKPPAPPPADDPEEEMEPDEPLDLTKLAS